MTTMGVRLIGGTTLIIDGTFKSKLNPLIPPKSKHGSTMGGGVSVVDGVVNEGITICGKSGMIGIGISKGAGFVMVGGSSGVSLAVGVCTT
jgi:hypothetical protein